MLKGNILMKSGKRKMGTTNMAKTLAKSVSCFTVGNQHKTITQSGRDVQKCMVLHTVHGKEVKHQHKTGGEI